MSADEPGLRMEEMGAAEVEAMLEEKNLGVLALARGGEPYAIPMAYRYGDGTVYFKFGVPTDSRKQTIVDENDTVSFVVYDIETDEGSGGYLQHHPWRSVQLNGHLRAVDDPEAVDVVVDTDRGDVPDNPWGEPRAEMSFTMYRLDAEEVSGRKAVLDD